MQPTKDMNDSLSSIGRFINRYSYLLLFILFALWICIGVFPLVCYEGDSMEVIFGCEILHQKGWILPPIQEYEYRMQPLTYIVVVAIRNILPIFSCEQIYCFITMVSSFAFLIGCVEFARHITHENRVKVLIAAMLLPEMYAIAMYPNSAILSAACFIWAFFCICRRKYAIAAILMCIAPLFRVDVVIVYPALFPMFFNEGKSLGKSIIYSGIYAIIVIIVVLFFYWLLHARVLTSIFGYGHWNNTISTPQVLMAIFGYYSLSYIILIPLGIFAIIRRKGWKELFLVLLPIIILHYVFRSMGCAAKHYLYLSPFVIIVGIRALSWIITLVREKSILKWISIAFVIMFYTISIRIVPSSRPWFGKNILYNAALIKPIYSAEIPSTKITAGIGAGQYAPTLDEIMLASGQLFYPLYIHIVKKETQDSFANLKSIIEEQPYSNVQAVEWGIRGFFASMFLDDCHQLSFKKGFCKLTGEGNTINILNLKMVEEESEARALVDRLKSLDMPLMDKIYIIAHTPHIRTCFDQLASEGLVEKVDERLYLLKINSSL